MMNFIAIVFVVSSAKRKTKKWARGGIVCSKTIKGIWGD